MIMLGFKVVSEPKFPIKFKIPFLVGQSQWVLGTKHDIITIKVPFLVQIREFVVSSICSMNNLQHFFLFQTRLSFINMEVSDC